VKVAFSNLGSKDLGFGKNTSELGRGTTGTASARRRSATRPGPHAPPASRPLPRLLPRAKNVRGCRIISRARKRPRTRGGMEMGWPSGPRARARRRHPPTGCAQFLARPGKAGARWVCFLCRERGSSDPRSDHTQLTVRTRVPACEVAGWLANSATVKRPGGVL